MGFHSSRTGTQIMTLRGLHRDDDTLIPGEFHVAAFVREDGKLVVQLARTWPRYETVASLEYDDEPPGPF